MKVDDRPSCVLGACGRWGELPHFCRRRPPCRQCHWGAGEAGAGSAGSGSASSQLSPTALLQEGEAGGVGNKLSLCSALGLLSSTVGTGRHTREDAGIQRRTGVAVGGFLGLRPDWEADMLLWAGPSAALVLKSFADGLRAGCEHV